MFLVNVFFFHIVNISTVFFLVFVFVSFHIVLVIYVQCSYKMCAHVLVLLCVELNVIVSFVYCPV